MQERRRNDFYNVLSWVLFLLLLAERQGARAETAECDLSGGGAFTVLNGERCLIPAGVYSLDGAVTIRDGGIVEMGVDGTQDPPIGVELTCHAFTVEAGGQVLLNGIASYLHTDTQISGAGG